MKGLHRLSIMCKGGDGTNSEALLLFHGCKLRLCEIEMLDFVKCTTCRRENIPTFFRTLVKTLKWFQNTCFDICENNNNVRKNDC